MLARAVAFRVGEKVVYPNHGVGVIEHISQGLDGSGRGFYQLRIEASNLRVMVPLDSVTSVGMRPITTAQGLAPILAYLECADSCEAAADWKCRFKDNSDKMRTGSLTQVAEVLKSLVRLHNTKPLSYREKKMLDRAALLLAGEWASASGIPEARALELLEAQLAKADLKLPPLDNTGT